MNKSKIIFWLLFVASLVLFFSPIQVEEHGGLGLDKIVHVIIFGVLMLSGSKSYSSKGKLALLLLLYVAAVEIIQANFVPHRSGDIYDAMAGGIGVAIAVFAKIR